MKGVVRILTLLLLLWANTARAQEDVAIVDGEPISAATFEQTYKQYLVRTGTHDSAQLRRAVLTQLINDRLLIAGGRRRGLDQSEAYERYAESARRKLLVDTFLATEVLDTIRVTEKDLESAFVRINTEVEARHLFASTRAEGQRLYERLMAGESFEDLAREVFVDTSLANNGGSLGTFTFDEMDPDFEDAAFSLEVGGVSEPVRTVQGYSIIQVTDRFTKPLLTEAEDARRKEKLRPLLVRKKRTQARSHYVRSRAEDVAPVWHDAFDRLLAQLTGVGLVPDQEMDRFLQERLVTFGPPDARTSWTVGDFRKHAANTSPRQRGQVRTALELQKFVTGLIIRDRMASAAERQGLDRTAAFRHAMASVMDAWILREQKERLIGEVRVPDDSVRAHYERFPAEFRTEDGEPMTFRQARPLIEQQLQLTYTRDYVLDYTAELRKKADVEVDEHVLLGLSVVGTSFAAAGPDLPDGSRTHLDEPPPDGAR